MDLTDRDAGPIVEVGLRNFDPDRDAWRLQGWLRQPHVAPWWGDAGLAMDDAVRRSPETCAVILADGLPVGYLCWQPLSPEERETAGLTDLPGRLVDIDILIGEPAAIGRGVGPRALGLVLDRLRGDPLATWAGVGTAVANQRAIRAFEKAGFRPVREFEDREFGLCCYLTAGVGHAARHRADG